MKSSADVKKFGETTSYSHPSDTVGKDFALCLRTPQNGQKARRHLVSCVWEITDQRFFAGYPFPLLIRQNAGVLLCLRSLDNATRALFRPYTKLDSDCRPPSIPVIRFSILPFKATVLKCEYSVASV